MMPRHSLADSRTPPQTTGTGGKAGFIQVDDRPLGLLRLVVALDKVLAPDVALGLKRLGVQQRFFYG